MYMLICMSIHIYIYIHNIHEWMYIYICINIHIHIYIHVFIYIYVYIHTTYVCPRMSRWKPHISLGLLPSQEMMAAMMGQAPASQAWATLGDLMKEGWVKRVIIGKMRISRDLVGSSWDDLMRILWDLVGMYGIDSDWNFRDRTWFDPENVHSNSGDMGMAARKMWGNQWKLQKEAATIGAQASSMVSAFTSIHVHVFIYIYMIYDIWYMKVTSLKRRVQSQLARWESVARSPFRSQEFKKTHHA